MISVGDIFAEQHYDPFTETFKSHLFLCYSAPHRKSKIKNNIYALRLTSVVESPNNDLKTLIKPSKLNNLNKLSFVCVDAVFLFKNGLARMPIGRLTKAEYENVLQRKKILESMQMDDFSQVFEVENR